MLPGLSMRFGSLPGFIVDIIVHPVEGTRLLAREAILRRSIIDSGRRRMIHYLPYGEIAIREQLRHGNRWRIRLLLRAAFAFGLALLLLLLDVLALTVVLGSLRTA